MTGCNQDLATDPAPQSPKFSKGTPETSNGSKDISKEKFEEYSAMQRKEAVQQEAIAAANREKYGHRMIEEKSTETGLTVADLLKEAKRRGLTPNTSFRTLSSTNGELQVSFGFGLAGGVVLAFNEFEVYSAAWTIGTGNQYCSFTNVDLTHQVRLKNVGDWYQAFYRFTSGTTQASSEKCSRFRDTDSERRKERIVRLARVWDLNQAIHSTD